MEGKVREKEDLVYSIQLRLYEIRLRLLDEVSVICMYACHVHVMCMSCAHVHVHYSCKAQTDMYTHCMSPVNICCKTLIGMHELHG